MEFIDIPTPAGKDRSRNQIDTIIIHGMSEWITDRSENYHAYDFLRSINLSCHYIVTPTGNTIRCAEPAERITWHARGHNTNSIGIEVLVPGWNTYEEFLQKMKTDWVSKKQYAEIVKLCRYCIDNYNIKHIAGHYDLDPARKQDPGTGFPFERLKADLARGYHG